MTKCSGMPQRAADATMEATKDLVNRVIEVVISGTESCRKLCMELMWI